MLPTEFTHLPTLFLFVSLLHPRLVSVWPPILFSVFPPHLFAASKLCILSALPLKFAVIWHFGQSIAEHLLQGPVWKKCLHLKITKLVTNHKISSLKALSGCRDEQIFLLGKQRFVHTCSMCKSKAYMNTH